MFEKELQELGLSDKEASVYVALLAVDNDSVVDLAKRTNINRTTIYPVLESLMNKGLVTEIKVDTKARFSAEPPERLVTFVERQKVIFEEKSERVKDFVPKLKTIQRESGEKPVITYFEGRDGIISSLENFFDYGKKGDLMHMIYSRDLVEDIFTLPEIKRFAKVRMDKNIEVRSVYTYSKGELEKSEGTKRFLIDNKYPIKTDISVIRDLVKISFLENNLSGILIKNKDLADTVRSIVEYIQDLNSKK